jgi:hypothetical protein
MIMNWEGPNRRSIPEDGERIAVLESNMSTLMEGQKTIVERIDALSSELTRYRGFAGGVLWVVGSIGAASIAVWEFMKDHIK